MERKVVYTPNAPAPIGPYSQAVTSGVTLYVSGQIALDAQSGQFISGSIEDETHKVMQNLGYILAAAGSSFDKVLKCTIFVKDLDDFSRINEVYGSYFHQAPPARETVEVSRLPKDASVEISAIALL